MKSFRIDDTEATAPARVQTCAMDASKRKRNRKDVQRRLNHMEDTIAAIQAIVEEGSYSPCHHEAVVINQSGPHKERTIIKPDYFPEQIIHHVAVKALQPCIMYGMGDFVLGSIPGRGAHYGKRYIEKWLRYDERNTRIIGKLDIRHFYQNIDHDVLKNWLHEKIRPGKIRDLCDLIIDGVEEGIPLGFYTSQLLNAYIRKANKERDRDQKFPIAVVHIVDIPLRDNIETVLKTVNKVSWLKLRFFPLNNDLDPMPLPQMMREDMKKVGGRTGNLVFNSPGSKEGITQVIHSTGGMAVASMRVTDSEGEIRNIKEDAFSSSSKIEYEGIISPQGDPYIVLQAKKNDVVNFTSKENLSLYERVKSQIKALMR